MRWQLTLLPQAEAEIREGFLWYFERSPIAADAFRSEVFGALDGLAEHADMWAADRKGLRQYHLSRFPYTVHYEIAGSQVLVYAVAHQRRRPGYWRKGTLYES
jgi:plasmid stabilization system protein ParE